MSTGTTTSSWADRLAGRPAWVPPRTGGRALAVVAHPDDEVLALAPVLLALAAAGWSCDLLALTDGEASYPGLDPAARRRLAAARRAELDAAWALLGLADRGGLRRAGLPDAGLPEVAAEVRAAVEAAAAPRDVDLVVGMWPLDPHRDHALAGRAAADLAARLGVPAVLAPLWARVRWDDDDGRLPWASVARVPVTPADARRRADALAAHASQVEGFEGHGPLLDADVLAALAGDGLVVADPW